MGPLQAAQKGWARCAQWVHKHLGYTEDMLRGGVQVFVGLLVLMSIVSTPKVWTSLSLPDAGIVPTFAVVTLCVVLQPNLGTAAQFVVMRALGAVVGGTLGLLSMYIAFGANGSSYHHSTTKGSVITTLLAVFSFCIGLFRFRYTRFWFTFVVATFSMPMVALGSFWLTYVQYKVLFYWWLQIALGISVAALVSMLVLPITAGQKVRLKTQNSLRKLGALTQAVLEAMLCPEGQPGAVAVEAEGESEGADAGPKHGLAQLPALTNSISSNIESVRDLLKSVVTEFDVYRKTHIFPTEAYLLLLLSTRAYLSTLLMLAYPLQSGQLSMRAVRAQAAEVRVAGACLEQALGQLAASIDGSVMYTDALASLAELERQWRVLGALCPAPQPGWTENDILAADMLLASLFNLGTRVRRMYLVMPDAIHLEQPGCRVAASRHFRASGAVWDMAPAQRPLRARALQRAGTSISVQAEARLSLPSPYSLSRQRTLSPGGKTSSPPAAGAAPWPAFASEKPGRGGRAGAAGAASPPGPVLVPSAALQQTTFLLITAQDRLEAASKASSENNNKDSKLGLDHQDHLHPHVVAESFPPLLPLPPLRHTPWGLALLHIREATGFTSEHICLAFQLAVGIAVASVLHVDREVFEALHERTIWAVVTVAVVMESTTGGILLKSALRVLGTALAGLLGVGLLYLAVLCNGGNYENHPAKFISMSVFLPLVGGLVMINHMRLPHQYGYLLSVAKFTTPIIALSGYMGKRVPWEIALWRLCNISIGVGIDIISTSTLFPITGRRATRNKVQETLHELASLSERVLSQFVSGPGLEVASPLVTAKRPRTFAGWRSMLPQLSKAFSIMPWSRQRSILPVQPADIELGRPASQQGQEAQQAQQGQQAAQQIQLHITPAGQQAQQGPRPGLGHAAAAAAAAGAAAGPSLQLEAIFPRLRRQQAAQQAQHGAAGAGATTQQALEQRGREAENATADDGRREQLPSLPSAAAAQQQGQRAQRLPPQRAFLAPVAEEEEGPLEPRASHATLPAGAGGDPSGGQAGGAPAGPADSPARHQTATGAAQQAALAGGESLTLPGRRAELPRLRVPDHHSSLATPGRPDSGPSGAGRGPVLSSRLLSMTSGGFISTTPKSAAAARERSVWLRRHVLGRVFVALQDQAAEVAALINELGELAVFAKFEAPLHPCTMERRLASKDIRAAQRACRKLLNVLLSCAFTLDAPDMPHMRLLVPFTREVQTVAAQIGECLRALSYIIGGHTSIQSALGIVSNLALQVQLLLLQVEQAPLPEGATEADVVLGYASLGVVFSSMQTVQALYLAVLRLLGTPGELAAAEGCFAQTAAWGASMEALLVAQGVVLSSVAADAGAEAAAAEAEQQVELHMGD